MAKNKQNCSSGIGGQAVLEGVMMKNKDDYAIAVRKADGSIVTEVDFYKGILGGTFVKKIPLVRGVLNFLDAMVLGMRTINYSASVFADDEDSKPTGFDRAMEKIFKGKAEDVLMGFAAVIAVLMAVAIFILAPFYLSAWLGGYIAERSWVLLIEGVLRITIFISYVSVISLLKDIRRLYAYHGAEHKCINCIENGRPLTSQDVMLSSRFHRRCGTSFMFLVIFISIIVFFFISADNIWLRAGLRLVLIPLIAGFSYEIVRWAGNSDNFIAMLLSAPGLLIQRLTTREPDQEMVEVAMQAVETVFDWQGYQNESRAQEVDEDWIEI